MHIAFGNRTLLWTRHKDKNDTQTTQLTEQKTHTNPVMANNTLVEAIMVEYVPAWIMRSHAAKNIEWRRRQIN